MKKPATDDRFRRVREARTLPEFDGAIAEIEGQIAEAEARRKKLREDLEFAVFTGADTGKVNAGIA